MTVLGCSKCSRLISLSDIPGGNPAARAKPAIWALSFGRCDGCGKTYCDKCIGSNRGKCPNCGKKVKIVQGHP